MAKGKRVVKVTVPYTDGKKKGTCLITTNGIKWRPANKRYMKLLRWAKIEQFCK
ncbi:MAG: hypothetical protein V1833_01445 [Elusimicrobiota bacterium]